MADALQDAKDALADAKLRMRVAEVGITVLFRCELRLMCVVC